MEFLVGIRTDDFVILASDKNHFEFGAVRISEDRNKVIKVGEKTYMACSGAPADVDDFSNWSQANLRLYKTRHGYELSPKSVHYWIRKNIADNLRTENYWQVNVLVGGYDDVEKKAFLGSVDYLGNSIPNQNYLFNGLPGRFSYAILDGIYKKDMSVDDGLAALHACLNETKKRVILNFNKYSVLIIDKNGARQLDDILQ